jgi:diacylglycerol kinase family enzyme
MDGQVEHHLVPGRSRRVAAMVALAAPVLAVVAIAESGTQHFGTFVVLLVAVAVATVAVWYGLTRRGVLRLLAAVVAAVAGTIVVLIGLSLFLLQVALLVVFGLAGRFALGPQAGTLLAAGVPARAVGPARTGVLLINPRSGDGTAARVNLAAAAAERGVRAIMLSPGDDLAALADRAARDGADVLGMAGGDGSQAIVAAAAVRHGVAYVCVPAGTRNHFALDLGLDRGDVAGALDAFTDGVERTVDLGRVNDRVFVNNASLGVYAEVVRSGGYRGAKIRTWGRLLPDLLGPGSVPSDLEFEGPDGKRRTGMSLVLVSNNPYEVSRVGRTGGRPRLDTGRLGILTARMRSSPDDAPGAGWQRFAGFLEWSRADFEVRSAGPVPVGLDGETLVMTPPLRFASLPGALRVRLPRRALSLRRRAALTRRDLSALARVAAGRPIVPAPSTGLPAPT